MFKIVRQPLRLLGHLGKRTTPPARIGCRYIADAPNNPLNKDAFDEKMLDVLVCPLSKGPLRFDRESNELICDEIGVAYPIVNGIPNLIPQDARKLNEES